VIVHYTVESIDGGMEVRLTRAHETRCRVWMCEEVAQSFLKGVTDHVEAELRKNAPEEYRRVLSRLIALMRAVLRGQPGGSIEVPNDVAGTLPFFN
jgi:hypothetical protein